MSYNRSIYESRKNDLQMNLFRVNQDKMWGLNMWTQEEKGSGMVGDSGLTDTTVSKMKRRETSRITQGAQRNILFLKRQRQRRLKRRKSLPHMADPFPWLLETNTVLLWQIILSQIK